MASNFLGDEPFEVSHKINLNIEALMKDLHQEVKSLRSENTTLRALLEESNDRAAKAEAALKQAREGGSELRNAQGAMATLNIPEVEETVGAGAVPPRGRSRSPRQKYTLQHDAAIVRWLLVNNKADEVGGNAVWREISIDNIAGENRTVESLQTHWRRMVRPKLENFGLSADELAKFK